MCEEFREVSGSILGSARFLNTLQDAIVGHQDVPYLVRLGFIDFILSLLRRFKEEEDSRDNVLSAIRFETWSYFTTSFLRNTHGNIYHCRYLELLLYVLDYEHEDALNVLLKNVRSSICFYVSTRMTTIAGVRCARPGLMPGSCLAIF